ncbi:hypothetical protein ACFQHV_17725 [Promicromonospora thailandica]|uniref:Uncharacterized protein n=1 Tax=Promicromonospora thailandica TaxID=765201 RepID=A0A9X2JU98_9MICO|nr:hypothetical protein [Promicromonospora thailandica]MCP2264300.1 hypothetical protein [Promicromonospora thailandica]BFF21015.1 hypothetical protein GCM10025730_45360 [Promicromonospora thailandica]
MDAAASADRVVWTEEDSAELERLQSQESYSFADVGQTLVYVRTSW